MDFREIGERLKKHLEVLTVQIGERSPHRPENLLMARNYIESCYRSIGLEPELEPYAYHGLPVANVTSRIDFCPSPSKCYVLGAHYDTVRGTPGADDNASAVAVQLETAGLLKELRDEKSADLSVKVVSFALEERPAFLSPGRGSKVHVQRARARREALEGAICLEMVGYRAQGPGSQRFPLPLRFAGYPREGTFISIIGNLGSRKLTRAVRNAFSHNPGLPVVSLTVPFNGWILPPIRRSDHVSFWDRGYKAVLITDTSFFRNPNYHKPSDTMETLDFDFMANLVKSLVLFFSSRR